MFINDLKNKLLSTDIFINNEFFEKYLNLVYYNLVEIDLNEQEDYELHHIIPKCYFKVKYKIKKLKYSKQDEVNKDNIVRLTLKDHLLAHYYLYRCAINNFWKEKFAYPLYFLLTKSNRSENDLTNLTEGEFKNILKELSDFRKSLGKSCSDETRRKISKTNKGHICWTKGKPLTEEHRKAISKANKGRVVSDDMKKHLSQKLKGVGKGIKKSEEFRQKLREREFTDEWREKLSKAAKEHLKDVDSDYWAKRRETFKSKKFHWYNNGEISIMLSENEIIPPGFNKGRLVKRKN